ncbi:MAG: glycosyltransferase family 2 protein [Candidatus Moranbacteria bacterium]|nr:glycosyltransferase family 2 protein [Candidatus Moranbacteria bacterium]
MDLSIVITNYRNPELLRICLDSVRKYASNLEYELIVADSATLEDTEMIMREDYQDVKFFPFKENVGFQALIKKGIEESVGKYLLLLNGDIIVTKASIENLLEFIKSDDVMGMVGPKLLNFDGSLQYSCSRFYHPITIIYRRTFLGYFSFAKKHIDWFLMKECDHNKTMEVDWLMGSALMVTRQAVEKVGFMDPGYFMYMEDVDWCRRFWENKYKVVYYPQAVMHHYHGRGSAKGGVIRSLLLNRLTWVHIFSAIRYFKKFWNRPVPKHQ